MLSNLFGGGTKKRVHCEITGKETSIDKTRVLTKISGVINLKLLDNPMVNINQKIIYSQGKPPINFFIKVRVPTELIGVLGDIYAIVSDVDELEQSTHILCDEGANVFMGRQLIKLSTHFKNYEIINFPDTMFFVSLNDTSNFKIRNNTCENWGINYPSLGKKYMVKKVLDTKIASRTFGTLGVLLPGYDLGIDDSCAKNPQGTGYLFKTERNFTPLDFCSNESAVDYCKKNNTLAYFSDFLNGGKMRVLSKYTESINNNLQNHYKFRSSNI